MTHAIRLATAGLCAVAALTTSGCTRGLDAADLNTRCEVHLEDLTWPVVDLEALTGHEFPSERCELHLLDRDDETQEWRAARVDPERWSIDCGLGEGARSCALSIDPVLRLSADDGVLLCEPEPGAECPGRVPGRRTTCRESAEVALGVDVGTEAPRNIVSVDTFESSDDLVAVTWVDGDYGDIDVVVSFLRREGAGWSLVGETDVCAECPITADGAPTVEYVAFQTATHGESLLLAGPCGSSAVVEVDAAGGCAAHAIAADPESTELVVPLALLETAARERPYAAFWTDGLSVYSTPLDAELRPQAPVTEHWREASTESREAPAAVCSEDASAEVACAVMWSEVERFAATARGDRVEASDELGASVLQWRVHRPGQAVEWAEGRQTLDDGLGGRFAARLEPDGAPARAGVLVSRHPVYGLVVRRWAAGDDGSFEYGASATQLEAGSDVVGFDVAPLTADTSVVTWSREVDDGAGIGPVEAAVIGEDGLALTRAGLAIPGISLPARAPGQRPLIAGGLAPGAEGRLALAWRETPGSCAYRVVTARGARAPGSSPPAIEWSDVEVRELEASGRCDACSGAMTWVGECVLAALPGAAGVDRFLLCPEAEPVALPALPGAPASCNVALHSDGDGGTVSLAFDGSSEPGVSIWVGRGAAPEWEWVEAAADGSIETARRASIGLDPAFAVGTGASGPVLLWTEMPWRNWPQRNVRVGRLDVAGPGDAPRCLNAAPAARDIADSRVAVAAVTPVACGNETSPGDDRACAFLALSRPDPGEVVEGAAAYDPRIYLTPHVAGQVIGVDGEGDGCEACGPVELVDEEIWRGLPTSLVARAGGPGAVDPAAPLGAFAEVPPTVWDRGSVSAFDFALGDRITATGEQVRAWQATPLDAGWLVGGEPLEGEARSLRLTSGGADLAAVWIVTMAGRDDALVFGLVDERLEPVTTGLVLESWPSEPAPDPHGDVRWLMAEHLQAGVTHVGAREFLVAFVSRPSTASALAPVAAARHVVCTEETLGQAPR